MDKEKLRQFIERIDIREEGGKTIVEVPDELVRLRAVNAELLIACEAALALPLIDEEFNAGYCRFCWTYIHDDHQDHFIGCPVPLLRAAVAKAKGP